MRKAVSNGAIYQLERKAVNSVPFLGNVFPLSNKLPAFNVAKVRLEADESLLQCRDVELVPLL